MPDAPADIGSVFGIPSDTPDTPDTTPETGLALGKPTTIDPLLDSGQHPDDPGNADGWSIERFLDNKIPDAPAFLADDSKQIESWKEVKGLLKQAVSANQALEMQIASAPAPAPAPDSDPDTTPDPALAEFAQNRDDFERWKAASAIKAEPSFQSQFESSRAAMLESIESIADEAGIDRATMNELLRSKSEFGAAKFLRENVEDETARGLLGSKMGEFVRVTSEREAALGADDPVAALREWQSKSASMSGERSIDEFKSAQATLADAFEKQLPTVTQDNPFFSTESGKEAVSTLNNRVANGQLFSVDEIASMALEAESARAYQIYATKLAENNAALEAKLQALGVSVAPGNSSAPVAPTPTDTSSIIPGMGSRQPFQLPQTAY